MKERDMREKKEIEELSDFFYSVDRTSYLGGPIRVMNYNALALACYDAGYRKKSGWISVDERLPEQYGLFLIADDKGNMEVASWTKQFGWFSGGNRVKRVTHWMPLPEPPKESKR